MNEFLKMIEEANTIAILGHIRPDGDCVGSCLGLYNYILENYDNKHVDVYLQQIPSKFNFLKGADKIKHEVTDTIYELGISLDCGDTDRHGEFASVFSNSQKKACIDHHRSNKGFGDYFYCNAEGSSTAEAICEHICMDKISSNVAEALYLGIVHDTGVFKYPSTVERTMQLAGKLISKGARSQYIIDETFYKVSYRQNLLTGEAVLNSKLHFDGKVISTCVTLDMFKEFGATKEDTEGIVDRLRVTDGVEVAVFVYQLTKDSYKFSLRSINYVDVSTIAVSFGGGGHYRAAGFEFKGVLDDAMNKVLSMIGGQL